MSLNSIQSFRFFTIQSRKPSLPQSLYELATQNSQANDKFTCQNCWANFNTNLDFQNHLLSDYLNEKDCIKESLRVLSQTTGIQIGGNNEKESAFRCILCSREFKSYKGMKQHMGKKHRIHNIEKNKQPKCEICSKEFKSYKGMKQHFGKKHNIKNKETICEICSKMFVNIHALNLHTKQVHEQSTRVTCPNCSRIFYNKYSLARHMEKDQCV